jgi:uroporphyrinogen decarboxylase
MTSRERMRRALRRQQPDHVPICDAFWDETITRWKAEGHLSPEVDVDKFFRLELRSVYLDSSFLLEEKVLENTAEYMVRRNAYGATARFFKGSPLAEYLDFPVKTRADWDKLKGRLRWHPHRFALTGFYSFDSSWKPPDRDWGRKVSGLEKLKASGNYIALSCYDAFEATWRKMGHEAALLALIEEPVWMREMLDAQIDLLIESYTEMERAGVTVDGFFMDSDLAFKTGPMFSPQSHRNLCLPGLKRLCTFLHQHDVDMLFHCDGDLRLLLPNLVEAGVDCIQPLEVHAGMDVRELKPIYRDKLAFMGNIGVDEMRLPEDELEAIMADKINTAKQGGGYVYHSDHSIPPDIPFERYLKVLGLARKYGQY